MPRILITGLPANLQNSEPLRELLLTTLPTAVASVRGLGIASTHVFAHAVPDLADERLERTVTFAVEGLMVKPERTAVMRQELCGKVADAIAAFLDQQSVAYAAIMGWCNQIDREDDGFARRASPSR